MKFVVLDSYGLNPCDPNWDSIRPFGDVRAYERAADTDEETIQRIGDAEILLLNKTYITEKVLAACPNIKLICMMATGYNVIDCDACARRNIPVCNVPAYSTYAVSQFTFALLLEICHQVGHHSQAVHNGRWAECPFYCFWDTPQMELAGKTLGIIGFGRIGQAVGRIAKAFGMKVIAYSRTHYPEAEEIAPYVDLDTLLAESDIISLHCPLFPETERIINAETISKMKDGVILVNTSRGMLVDEIALTEALNSGKVRFAAVDVVSQEPPVDPNPLLTAPNCIITPHMAWAPVEARQRILDVTIDNVRGFLKGEYINVVNSL